MNIITRFLLLIFLLGISHKIMPQSPSWQWIESSYVTPRNEGRSVCTDNNGNVYVTGNFNDSTIVLGGFTLINHRLYLTGASDGFIAKYNSSGNVLWAKAIGGISWDYSHDICCDMNGNVYVTGEFMSDTLAFGSIHLVNSGAIDIFLVKYDSIGNVVWAKNEGGTEHDIGASVFADNQGNVVVAGCYYSPTIQVGSIVLNHSVNWQKDIFVIKYDQYGSCLWAKSVGGNGYDLVNSISIDDLGNTCVVGDFNSDSICFASFTLYKSGMPTNAKDMFVVKYDPNGNVIWAKSFGGANEDSGESICADQNGNIYIGGYYTSDSIRFDNYLFANSNNWRLFLVKLDMNGNVAWANEGLGGGFFNHSLAVDVEGSVFITGQIWASYLTFGSVTITIPVSNTADIFVMKFDTAGNSIWGKSVCGFGYEDSYGITVDLNSNIYITGRYSSNPTVFDNINLISLGPDVFFLAKLFDPTSVHSEFELNNSVQTFPNPFEESLVVETNSTEKSKAVLINMQGEKILECNLYPGQNVINTQLVKPGVYILQITSENGITNKKVIKSF